jgi:DNA ligase (NAD+)
VLAGIVVPVAQLEAVQIAGVTIQRASLHNTDYVASKDLRVGDSVVVERRGDVIPQISKVILEKRPRDAAPWAPPVTCPACGCSLQLRSQQGCADRGGGNPAGSAVPAKHKAGVGVLMCVNSQCVGRRGRLLEHFAATCIKGLSKQTIEDFIGIGLCSSPVDLYRLGSKRPEVRCLRGCNGMYASNT